MSAYTDMPSAELIPLLRTDPDALAEFNRRVVVDASQHQHQHHSRGGVPVGAGQLVPQPAAPAQPIGPAYARGTDPRTFARTPTDTDQES